ncbi:MAG: ATP-binding protein [Spirochaetes bacterium RBG_13_51_14]|nr:MAG: ATP-binding protein [Spirochaetes bacterium RBG_13_51_14]
MADVRCASIIKNFENPRVEVLKSISFDIGRGDFVAVTGKSGSGKSTLLYILSGLDTPTAGRVIIDGKNIFDLPEAEMNHFRNTRMGFVFQFHYLLPELTSLDNVLMPARKLKREKEVRERALELLRRFDLEHCVGKHPAQMSGGEQQRVAVARSLIMGPDILFADEPTGNLDSVNGERIMNMLREINDKSGTTVILVTHEPDYAAIAGRQIHLTDGRIDRDKKKTVKGY